VKVVASVSKTEDFANSVFVESKVEPGANSAALHLSFEEKEDELEALNANKLYLKIQIVSNEEDKSFDPSWVVLGKIQVSGAEKLKGSSNEEEKVYLGYDFSKTNTLEAGVVEKENVIIRDGKLIPEQLGQVSYVVYEIKAENELNSFEKLKLDLKDISLISKSAQKVDEEGVPVEDENGEPVLEDIGKTRITAYVSSDADFFGGEGTKLESTIEGVTEGVIDLSKNVASITTQTIYVKVEMGKDDVEFDNPFAHLNVGKLAFVGEESRKVSGYLDKNLHNSLEEAKSHKNVVLYDEKETQEQLVLKGKNSCEHIIYSYNEDGEVENTRKANVCTWTEKGIKYNRNIVSGLNSEQLEFAIDDLGLTASTEEGKLYKGKINYGSVQNVPVFIRKVAEAYYELVFDLETFTTGQTSVDITLTNSTKKKAYEYSAKVFQDFEAVGEGNVVYVISDGVRELYVHTGKLLQRVSDYKTFKR